MKRLNIKAYLLSIGLVLCSAIGVVSTSIKPQEHKHEANTHIILTDYRYNEQGHWFNCALGAKCTAYHDYAEHTLNISSLESTTRNDTTVTFVYNVYCPVCSYHGKRTSVVTLTSDNVFTSVDDDYHSYEVTNDYETKTVNEEHSYTLQFCTDDDCTSFITKYYVCSDCGHDKYVYEPAKYSEHDIDTSTWCTDGNTHWHACKHDGCEVHCDEESCDNETTWGRNDPDDCTSYIWIKTKCKVCGHEFNSGSTPEYETHYASSSASYMNDNYGHWHQCEHKDCTAKLDYEVHTLVQHRDGTGHWDECSKCGYVSEKQNHHIINKQKVDKEYHYIECDKCGFKGNQEHKLSIVFIGFEDDDCTNTAIKHYFCEICNESVDKTVDPIYTEHIYKEEYEHDYDYHWHKCSHQYCEETTEKEEHHFDEWDVGCDEHQIYTHTFVCEDCGFTKPAMGPGKHDYIKVEKVEATPDHDGCKQHYVCKKCGKLFVYSYINEDYKEVSEKDLVIKYEAPEKVTPKNVSYIWIIALVTGVTTIFIVITIFIIISNRRKEDKKENKQQ